MHTLLIGYGKIGQIKAGIWRSLGRTVHVYDPNEQKVAQAIADGFAVFDSAAAYDGDVIVDISTPAMYHLESLEWALEVLDAVPRSILMEKPLASGPIELNAFVDLAADPDFASIKDMIAINESYYLSSGLEYVMHQLAERSAHVTSIRMELSKNRLDDVAAGRFVDEYLGTLGIELPHMIAMAQRLGVDLTALRVDQVAVFGDEQQPHNGGFRLKLTHQGIPVVLESYLGDFRVTDADATTPNAGVTRTLEVVTSDETYSLVFDPIPGEKRYVTRVNTYDPMGTPLKTTTLPDNHLARNLTKMHTGTVDGVLDPLLSLENAIEITTYLFMLKERAQHFPIPRQ